MNLSGMSAEEDLKAITERLASCDCWVCEDDRMSDSQGSADG